MKKEETENSLKEMYSSENISKKYKEYLLDLANMQAKIRDIRDYLKDVSIVKSDNGDTYIDAEAVLIDISSLLADMIVYQHEYEEDAL